MREEKSSFLKLFSVMSENMSGGKGEREKKKKFCTLRLEEKQVRKVIEIELQCMEEFLWE